MEPTARAPKPPTSTLRRYLPFVAGLLVIALVVVILNVSSGGDTKNSGPSKPTVPSAGGGPVTLSAANRDSLAPFFEQVVASPHSVVTAHLIDEAGQPTIAARDEILSFFAHRLTS